MYPLEKGRATGQKICCKITLSQRPGRMWSPAKEVCASACVCFLVKATDSSMEKLIAKVQFSQCVKPKSLEFIDANAQSLVTPSLWILFAEFFSDKL